MDYADPPADILAAYLVAAGVGVSPQPVPIDPTVYVIVVGNVPPGGPPDNIIELTDTGALLYDKVANISPAVRSRFPLVTFTIRGTQYAEAMRKGQQIEAELERFGLDEGSGPYWPLVTTTAPASYRLLACKIRMPTTKIGQEEMNRRQIFTLNVQLTIKRIS